MVSFQQGGPVLAKLQRMTLTEQAVRSLLDYIASEGLKPGAVLPSESKLAAAFGVSRQVIREALKSLEGQNVVSMINGRGAILKPIDGRSLQTFFARAVQMDQKAILELMEVRRGLEIESAILAAERRTPEELVHLTEIVMSMSQQLNDLDIYRELDVSLHVQIAAATHNSMLYHLVESLLHSGQDAIRQGLLRRHTDEELRRVQQLHEALLQELARGDGVAAGRAMALHFDDAVTVLVREGL